MNWKPVPEKEIPEPFLGAIKVLNHKNKYYAVCNISKKWSLYLAQDFTLIAKHYEEFDPPPAKWATDQLDLYENYLKHKTGDKDLFFHFNLISDDGEKYLVSNSSIRHVYLTIDHHVPVHAVDLIPITQSFYLYIDKDNSYERIIAVRPHYEH